MRNFFISYSRKDDQFARRLASSLSKLGVKVWIDVQSIPAGENWASSVPEGLDTCDVMLLILSPDSMGSQNVQDEWQYFRNYRKKLIIPLMWRACKVHFQLFMLHRVEFRDSETDYDTGFRSLVAYLKRKGIELDGALPPAPAKPAYIQGNEPATTSIKSLIERVKGILPSPFEWCFIPGGKVFLEEGGYVPKGGQEFQVDDFYMAKYPVTNAQFQVFVDDKDGYRNAGWWDYSEAAKKWRAENSQPESTGFSTDDIYRLASLFKAENSQPESTGFSGDDLPQTTVSWYESVAFCRWLNQALTPLPPTPGTRGSSGERGIITLPTEQEWQRAAVGDTGYVYPWGKNFDKTLCNTRESGIGKVTPVTQYPKGASPYGVMDMSGNVWEWCLTEYEIGNININRTEVHNRVLRGGYFRAIQQSSRAAYRSSYAPPNGDYLSLGFRVCVLRPPSLIG